MITLGNYYTLPVVKQVEFGFYLDAGELDTVLLPRRYAPEGLAVGDELEVFLYLDSEDRPVATTEKPKARVGEFALLTVVSTGPVGAFLDWGLPKDLLVPFSEQHRRMEPGKSYLVYLYLDKVQGRITASSKLDKFLEDSQPRGFRSGQEVELIIAGATDLGIKAIVDGRHWGLIHHDDAGEAPGYGRKTRGVIKRVRPDGKIDLLLQSGAESRDENARRLLDFLRRNAGYAPLHDKSDPRLIQQSLGMSKAAFKKAVGRLYSERLIALEEGGIRLLEGEDARRRGRDR